MKNDDHLDFIRLLYCCSCGHPPKNDPHHVQSNPCDGTGNHKSGKNVKVSDYKTIPLCRLCHTKMHIKGEKLFFLDMDKLHKLTDELATVSGNIDHGNIIVYRYWVGLSLLKEKLHDI